jgi:hypothetical protein
MKTKLTLWASMLAMLVFAGVASAKGVSEDSLNKLLTLSGIEKQVKSLPEAMKAGVEQAKARAAQQPGSKLSGQDFDDIEVALSNAFQPDALLKSTADAIRNKVSEADAKQLIAWYQSDLGKKITQAELDAASSNAQQDMMAHAQELMADKPRVAFARKLGKMLHATDDAMKFREDGALAMFSAMSAKMNPGQPVDLKTFKARLDGALAQARPNIDAVVTLGYVYAYRNLDMASLKKYGKFQERPATRRFNDGARAGLTAGLEQAISKVAGNIAPSGK